MITIICILVFIFASFVEADCDDQAYYRRKDYEIAERRHRETLSAIKKKKSKTTHRRIIKKGDVTIGEEVTEEEL